MRKIKTKASQSEVPGEIWKDISEYKGIYQVSSIGRIKSMPKINRPTIHIMKNVIDSHGYLVCCLSVNNKAKSERVHRIVAKAFLSNIHKKEEVNHINGVKTDSRVENLEWCTRSENAIHSYNNELQKGTWRGKTGEAHSKSKLVLDTETGIFYGSRNEAAMAKGIPPSSLTEMLNGRYKNKTSLIYV